MVFTSQVGRGNESPTPAPEREEHCFFPNPLFLSFLRLSCPMTPGLPSSLQLGLGPSWSLGSPAGASSCPSVSASLCPFLVPLSVSPSSQAEQRGTYRERQEEKLPAPLWMLQESQSVGKDSEAQRSGVSLSPYTLHILPGQRHLAQAQLCPGMATDSRSQGRGVAGTQDSALGETASCVSGGPAWQSKRMPQSPCIYLYPLPG